MSQIQAKQEMQKQNQRIIISISSDIGTALAHSWLDNGHSVSGTYRTLTPALKDLESRGVKLVYCDLADNDTINNSMTELQGVGIWDVLVIAPGAQEPVGPFLDINFDDWERSINVNFTGQLRLVQGLLKTRNLNNWIEPIVLFFAGGGTNNATLNYSAYTIAKISSIKICELLDAEITDTRFAIVGPGWVRTKIHEATLREPEMAGENYERTVSMLESDDCVPMASVIECCDWLLSSKREHISGRNFSLVFDNWGSRELDEALKLNTNMYKLRREGNNMNTVSKSSRDANPEEVLGGVWQLLKSDLKCHIPGSNQYDQLKNSARYAAQNLFNQETSDGAQFGDFGKIILPFYKMGAINSIDLFGLDELIIFAFYWKNRLTYKNICDVGANIGLHSIILAKCGYQVKSFEPDPVHIKKINENLSLNGITEKVEIVEAAVSDTEGSAEFVRLLGNTTGSHLAGSKDSPYGEMDRFQVKLKAISELMEWADFIKIDAEGHETKILLGTTASHWQTTDAIVEIGSVQSAELIFDHLSDIDVKIFSQKIGWQQARSSLDLPVSHLEGSAFISCKEKMPW